MASSPPLLLSAQLKGATLILSMLWFWVSAIWLEMPYQWAWETISVPLLTLSIRKRNTNERNGTYLSQLCYDFTPALVSFSLLCNTKNKLSYLYFVLHQNAHVY